MQDPVRTLKFYREILGMRILFTYNAGSFSIYCQSCGLGLAASERPGARRLTGARRGMRVADVYHGDEDTEAVWANFPNQKGLVERKHLLWKVAATPRLSVRADHLGLIVRCSNPRHEQ